MLVYLAILFLVFLMLHAGQLFCKLSKAIHASYVFFSVHYCFMDILSTVLNKHIQCIQAMYMLFYVQFQSNSSYREVCKDNFRVLFVHTHIILLPIQPNKHLYK